jgi:hypothetical protein
MHKWHGGKGSQPRKVDPKKFSENWDKVFKIHDKCGTPECCGQCETVKKSDYK